MRLVPPQEVILAAGYNPETGEFKQTVHWWSGYGYLLFKVAKDKYMRFYAHRVAWASQTGEWPAGEIDHKNGNRSDNRWCNLRLATRSQNSANQGLRANNKSGVKGVYWYKRDGIWCASIRVNGRNIHLGRFHDIEDAARAYGIAAKHYFGEFARPERT